MPGTQCQNCRWWNGDAEQARNSYSEVLKHGKCEHIISSHALRDDWPVRLYPVGVNAWVSTRFDFSCRDWERAVASIVKAS